MLFVFGGVMYAILGTQLEAITANDDSVDLLGIYRGDLAAGIAEPNEFYTLYGAGSGRYRR